MKLETYIHALEINAYKFGYYIGVDKMELADKCNKRHLRLHKGIMKRIKNLEFRSKSYKDAYILQEIRAGRFTEKQ